MRLTATIGFTLLLSLGACTKEVPEAPVIETTSEPVAEETATPDATATQCASYASDYTISYEDGATALPEGEQEALDRGFRKLLPLVTECGNFHVTLLASSTLLTETEAAARAKIIEDVFTESYFVPASLIDTQLVSPETDAFTGEPVEPSVIIQLRIDDTSQ